MGVDLKMDGVTVNVDATSAPTPLDAQGKAVTGAQQLKITPETVHVQVAVTQQLSYKTVAIQASVGGTPQSGFAIQGITVEPPVATLAGAPTALSGVDFAASEHIDVSDANGTLARQVAILVPPGVFVVQQDLVRVTVRIGPLDIAQTVTTAVTADNLPDGARLAGKIPLVQITLDGPAPAFRLLNFGDVKARVDLSGLGPGTHSMPVQVSAPGDFSIVSVIPDLVTVMLEAPAQPGPTSAPSEESIVQS
jgi:YbbR domain-containing protein